MAEVIDQLNTYKQTSNDRLQALCQLNTKYISDLKVVGVFVLSFSAC